MVKYTKWLESAGDDLIRDVAVRGLQSRFEPVQDYVVLAANKLDREIEYVHQMRVWSRRAVAALSVFRKLLPKRRRWWMKEQLQWIRRSSNDARDDDVFALRLAADKDNRGAAKLIEKVGAHREETQQPIVDVYQQLIESGIFKRRAAKLLDRVRLRGKAAASRDVQFGDWAAQRMRPPLDKFFRAAEADLSDVKALHEFRIQGKKLRYAMELLASAFPDGFRTDVYPMIRELQDKLGEINDHATARATLRNWIGQSSGKQVDAYLQEMLNQEQSYLDERHSEFLSWWNGKREKELRKAFAGVLPRP